ncbi:DNA cytosine methyltransferase [Agromyces binzhouensis]|uniref:DNA cytosine methyltransferase n=1 Tax=Agromyces binzhouensis TaxID=1817495 RepID=UPI003638CDE9
MIPVIDLFAGPGGLNEGFSSVRALNGDAVFRTVGSYEMERAATDTLTLRAAIHRASEHGDEGAYYRFLRDEIPFSALTDDPRFGRALRDAANHVHRIELSESTRAEYAASIRASLSGVLKGGDPWVLIGGPPCQAYSLVGRARRTHDREFEQDKKHFLYREYLHIISEFRPPVFVMENVKGLLSSTHGGTGMFARILSDLKRPASDLRYNVVSLTVEGDSDALEPSDFIIRSEQFGVPQARHRVILLGIRSDVQFNSGGPSRLRRSEAVTVGDALHSMPMLRSGISRSFDDDFAWHGLRDAFAAAAREDGIDSQPFDDRALSRGKRFMPSGTVMLAGSKGGYGSFVHDSRIGGVVQHATRAHMVTDLERYYFAASFARQNRRSPKLGDFPGRLLPNHRNATAAMRPFEDRFRVQLSAKPSSTIVSHMAKDGHYFIHPDPSQMRSLTVREAARLQSFPDNYFFMGTRTQQYTQVGNAVPPYLAHQIARIVAGLFGAAVSFP